MKKKIVTIFVLFSITAFSQNIVQNAKNAIEKGVEYYYSINVHGGYVYSYTLDMTERWGESRTDDNTIEVQPPGTPAVGMSFIRAYHATSSQTALEAAKAAAFALIRGQNDLGGWDHTINVTHKSDIVSFDDNQTQSAIRFLMQLDQIIDEDSLTHSIEKAMDMMQKSQLTDGGWPHKYPEQGNYHDFATFNDGGINDCIQVMMDAWQYYKNPEYRQSLEKVGRFLMISQIAPPQPGWAQQYNQHLQPAWARDFEPPAACPLVTIRVMNSLLDLFECLNDPHYLVAIPDALNWLDDIQLPNGKWARFVELYTNKPLYYDRGRIRVETTDSLHIERRTGYGYESDLSNALSAVKKRCQITINAVQNKIPLPEPMQTKDGIQARLLEIEPQIKEIIKSQDAQGRWVSKNDKYKNYIPGVRWSGEYITKDRINSTVFNMNINLLCEYLELQEKLKNL